MGSGRERFLSLFHPWAEVSVRQGQASGFATCVLCDTPTVSWNQETKQGTAVWSREQATEGSAML